MKKIFLGGGGLHGFQRTVMGGNQSWPPEY